MVGALRKIIPESRVEILERGRLLSQSLQDLRQGPAAAGEDRGIQLGIGARFALPELHHQVLELLGGFGLEGEDELVVVYPEAVTRIVLYGIVFASDLHVLVHHALTLFDGQPVPRPRLDEWIDEEILALPGDDVRGGLEAGRVLAYVDGASAQCKVGVVDAQVLAA